ncbi:hypothetical protein CN311_20350 [Mesorhizobium sanjuanii]|uniref:Uncharacterized protein n=1 Tax=Mesorhizobium sanjuanii TaxID=2037900 RepID=A0A2A6FBM8_9HYPH|nr:hypothetical protein CN311_20350 [Mesorhizobium sanjuanii]
MGHHQRCLTSRLSGTLLFVSSNGVGLGKAYKLNAETDLDDIVIAYDVTNGENVVTDMQLPDGD